MCTFTVGGTRVGQASDGDSNEMVTFTDPPAGTYTVYVHGFNTNGPSADFTLFSWQITSANAGNMTVPGPVSTTHRWNGASEPFVHRTRQRHVVSRPDRL